jgi:hypothetical protein
MNDFKATPGQWDELEGWAGHGSTVACILELRARVEALEAHANHIGDSNKMVPPPVATDEELRAAWNVPGTNLDAFRAIYNLGLEHGQAGSRKMAEPAPVARGLVDELVVDLRIMASQATKAGQVSDGVTLRHAANMLQQLSEQEAGR